MAYKWYIINVVSGQEQKVFNAIKAIISTEGEKSGIKDVMIPVKEVAKIKRGKKVQDTQKLFPGYVFVHMDIETTAINRVRSTPKVMGFLGSKTNPEPVSDEKIENIVKTMSSDVEAASGTEFEVGEVLRVTQGPFESFTGTVESVDNEKKRVKMSISIFGRTTQLDLESSQVERIES